MLSEQTEKTEDEGPGFGWMSPDRRRKVAMNGW
jgi:hypothetical protein